MALGDKSHHGSSKKPTSNGAIKSTKIKSAEIIKDSDDEDPEETQVYKEQTSQSSGDGVKVASPGRSKAPSHKKSAVLQTAGAKIKDFSGFPKQSPSILNGRPSKKRKIDISSSSSSDSQESNSQNDEEEGSNGSQSETSSGIGRSNGSEAQPVAKTSVLASQRPTQKPKNLPYTPPPGFECATINLPPASDIAQILSASALRGKQLWYITIPNSVPVSSITEVSTRSFSTGAAVVSYNGAEYGLIPETQDKTAQRMVLLPSSSTGEYECASIEIAKTLHLQQIVRLPNPNDGPDRPTNDNSTQFTKRRNQQPPGLKMRYRPFGVSSESPEKSESEPTAKEPPQAAQFRVPRNIDTSSSATRKRDQIDQIDGTESPAKVKRKKTLDLKDLEQTHTQRPKHSQSLAELPKGHTEAESEADLNYTSTISEDEPTDTPRPKSVNKTKPHHHKELDSPTCPPKSLSLTEPAPLPHSPLLIPNTPPTPQHHKPSPKNTHKNTQALPPSPGNETPHKMKTVPIKESQHGAIHLDEIQQHAGRDEDHAPRASKRNGTAEERATRKAERRKRKEEKGRGEDGGAAGEGGGRRVR